MFKDSSSRNQGRNSSRNLQFEGNENEFEASQSIPNFPPPRTPLNAIADPCQFQESEASSHHKFEAIRPGRYMFNFGTPRGLGRNGKANSEPNSAQSTPARISSRISLGGKGSSLFKSISGANSEFCKEVKHFELKEDPSFWMDHNVQVS